MASRNLATTERRLPQHLVEKPLEWTVPLGGLEVERDATHSETVKQLFHAPVFNATGERAAAHHPCLNLNRVVPAGAAQRGDFPEWAILVFVGNDHDEPAGALQQAGK